MEKDQKNVEATFNLTGSQTKEAVTSKEEASNVIESEKKDETNTKEEGLMSDEEIPDHFYDSDLASVNEKDFMSDNEPPKDHIQERKLLYKEKMLHVFKTIIRLGQNIDKPARFDRIKVKLKQVGADGVVPRPLKKTEEEYDYPQYFSTLYLMDVESIEYNLGKEYLEVERLMTSMKRGQAAVFELQYLQTSKKSSLKTRTKVQVFVIGMEDWTTVIDVDCDGKFMKEVLQRGEGHSRISKHDEVSFQFTLMRGERLVVGNKYEKPVKLEDDYLQTVPEVLWKMLSSLKTKEVVRVLISDEVMREVEGLKYQHLGVVEGDQGQWVLKIEIFAFHSIDNIFMDGRLLKKVLIRGVSTAKPDSASLIYYALRFIGKQGQLLFEDPFFNSDWWQDYSKLDELGCRKSYLDDQSVSMMLKQVIKRMKPAQIAQIECRDKTLFTYGSDYEEFKKLAGEEIPEVINIGIRVYNFTEGRNCFNMELDEKVKEAKRKKVVGVKVLGRGEIGRALKIFESIVSYFGSGKINQQAYDEKISALMNSTLCHLKNENYTELIKLCDLVLEVPRHGYDPTKLKIKGPGHAKIEGKLPDEPDEDERQQAELEQNKKIIDKCFYRKALALTKMGQGGLALQNLQKMSMKNEQALMLQKEAQKLKEAYEKKSVKMFKNMFG